MDKRHKELIDRYSRASRRIEQVAVDKLSSSTAQIRQLKAENEKLIEVLVRVQKMASTEHRRSANVMERLLQNVEAITENTLKEVGE